jgi:hypothetical protein
MCNFTLKELNFVRIRQWIIDTKNKQDADPVYSFIAAWIGFNHFYGTFASINSKDFSAWLNSRHPGDRAQLMYLIQTKEFVEFFDAFKSEQQELFSIEIKLPIINPLNERGVPDGVKGKYKLYDLPINQIFEVVYQIRNNLFHGDKDPFRDERDKELSCFGSEFMLLFISSLLSRTYGEELDAFDNQQQEEIEIVKRIAKGTRKD